jgi:hypothetical protein
MVENKWFSALEGVAGLVPIHVPSSSHFQKSADRLANIIAPTSRSAKDIVKVIPVEEEHHCEEMSLLDCFKSGVPWINAHHFLLLFFLILRNKIPQRGSACSVVIWAKLFRLPRPRPVVVAAVMQKKLT